MTKKHKTIKILCMQIRTLALPQTTTPTDFIAVGDVEEDTTTEAEEEDDTVDGIMRDTMINTMVIMICRRLHVSAVIRTDTMHPHVLIAC